MPRPIRTDSQGLDLSARFESSAAVVASPAAAAETIIASLTLPDDIAVVEAIMVVGFAAFTVGTDGTASNLRIRRTNVSGTIVKATGALTGAATVLLAPSIIGVDTGATMPGQVYVLTLQVTNGSAPSTVSAVTLAAIIV